MTTLRHHCTHKGCREVIEYDPSAKYEHQRFADQHIIFLTCPYGHVNRIILPHTETEAAHPKDAAHPNDAHPKTVWQHTVSSTAHMNRSRDLPPGLISTLKPVQWKHDDTKSAFSQRILEQQSHDKGIARWRRGRGESR